VHNDGTKLYEVSVSVDDLRPVRKAPTDPVETVVQHPRLQVGGSSLDVYDYELCEYHTKKTLLAHLLMQLHVRNIHNVENVTVNRLSAEGALPIVLQARAKNPFKSGALLLSPLGEIALDDDAQRVELKKLKNKKLVHESMLRYAEASVGSSTDKRKPVTCANVRMKKYVVMSPLMDALSAAKREKCLQNLSPFWAVLGTEGAQFSHNMELEIMVFREQAFAQTPAIFPKLPPGTSFEVQVPILKSVTPIQKNEVLCIAPFDQH